MPGLTFGSILAWIIIGLVVGVLARLLVPGPTPMSLLGAAFLGVVGSFVGGLVAYALNLYDPSSPAAWILSILGAALLLLFHNGVGGARRGPIPE